MDHEQQQLSILMQEQGRDHQESILQVRRQMLQELHKLQQRAAERVAKAQEENQQRVLAQHQHLPAAIGDCQLRLMVQDGRISALETSASTLMRKQLQLVREQLQQTTTTSPTTSLTPAMTKDPSKDDVPNENSSSSSSSSSINADN